MMSSLLAMDVEGARSMASDLDRWPGQVGEIVELVTQGEVLADLPTGAVGLVAEIADDAAAISAAIRRAADALESFTVDLASPRSIALAVADVKAFRGRDNDPELDRRLRTLRGLVEQSTSSTTDAALVMAAVLAADLPVHFGLRDLTEVERALRVVDDLVAAEATGALSANDPRIDAAVAELRTAVDAHSTSDAQTDAMLRRLLEPEREADAAALLASVVSGHDVDVVRVAHGNDLDYDIADGLIKMSEVDRLSHALTASGLAGVDALIGERRELLVELAGTDDPLVLVSLTEMINGGATAIEAFSNLDGHVAERLHEEQIAVVADDFGVDLDSAELLLSEMHDATMELISADVDLETAAMVAHSAATAGLDIAAVTELVRTDGMEAKKALETVAEADVHGMTVSEYQAFRGLEEHWEILDDHDEAKRDGIVSLERLEYIVANPEGLSADAVAAAAALIAAPALRHRLDRGRDHGEVVGSAAFGALTPDDEKISRDDIAMFRTKQQVNFLLQDQLDTIDVAAQGGNPALVDHRYSEADFEQVLAQADAGTLVLTPGERSAIELVLEADWYDKTFWQEHGDDLLLATATVAGFAIFAATAGTGAPVSTVLIASAQAALGGALTASALTIGENLLTGDEWDEDLHAHALTGGVGGLGGAGFAGLATGAVSSSLAVRVVNNVGFAADTAGLAAAGLFDPLLAPILDDTELEDFKETATTTGYVAGGLSIAGAGVSALGSRLSAGRVGSSVADTPINYANYGGEAFDDGLAGMASRLELTPAQAAAAADAAAAAAEETSELARLAARSDELTSAAVIGVGQRSTGVAFDLISAADDDRENDDG